MQVFKYTNKGSRKDNQDYVVDKVLSADCSIFVVADGMGGYSYGDIAASTVGNAIVEYADMNYTRLSPAELLKEAISYSNDCLMLKRISLNANKMGCVVVVLLIINDNGYLCWLGDSRLYIFRNGTEVYQTEDHSVLNDLSRIECLDSSDIRKYASIVTKAVMGDDNLGQLKVSHVSIEKGDIFLLCSDGFHKELNVDTALGYSQQDLDNMSDQMSDNYSFIKITI
jgi:protein phosphatase